MVGEYGVMQEEGVMSMGMTARSRGAGRSSRKKPARAKKPAAPKDWEAATRRAETALRRSSAAIEAGETTGTKRTGKQGAPSRYGGGKNS